MNSWGRMEPCPSQRVTTGRTKGSRELRRGQGGRHPRSGRQTAGASVPELLGDSRSARHGYDRTSTELRQLDRYSGSRLRISPSHAFVRTVDHLPWRHKNETTCADLPCTDW